MSCPLLSPFTVILCNRPGFSNVLQFCISINCINISYTMPHTSTGRLALLFAQCNGKLLLYSASNRKVDVLEHNTVHAASYVKGQDKTHIHTYSKFRVTNNITCMSRDCRTKPGSQPLPYSSLFLCNSMMHTQLYCLWTCSKGSNANLCGHTDPNNDIFALYINAK